MTQAASIEALSKNLLEQEELLKRSLADQIRALAGECKNSKTFTVMLSELSPQKILLPSYYNINGQYHEIAEMVLKTPLSGLEKLIQKIQTVTTYQKKVRESVLNLWKEKVCLPVQKKKPTPEIY